MKSNLPGKEIYLSWPAGTFFKPFMAFFRPTQWLPLLSIPSALPMQISYSVVAEFGTILVLDCMSNFKKTMMQPFNTTAM